jgi:hypothetical protein
MKFNLFLLPIVLLGSIPCFYAALDATDPCKDMTKHSREATFQASQTLERVEVRKVRKEVRKVRRQCRRGNRYLKRTFNCKEEGMEAIRELANNVYLHHLETIKKADVGDFFHVGTITGDAPCNGISADSCSCKQSRIEEVSPPQNLGSITTKEQSFGTNIGEFLILVERLQKGSNKNCKFAIANKVNDEFFIMPMTCPRKTAFIVSAMLADEAPGPAPGPAPGLIPAPGETASIKRRRLLHQGGCDT